MKLYSFTDILLIRVFLRKAALVVTLFALSASLAYAQGLGALRGTVKDPSGAVVPEAHVTLKAVASARTQTTKTDTKGGFIINGIPFGDYRIEVEHEGFTPLIQPIQIIIGSAPNVDLKLAVNSAKSTVEVTAAATQLEECAPSAAHPPVMVSSEEIMEGLPGADRMSSLAFITETTPGAFVLHDHLHVRGGHQINYMINGVPIPNTNMSSNVGRAMDPGDIEEVEINRGGYGAQSGDRTFAQVNMLTRSGFELGNHEGDLNLGYGSYHQSNDKLSYGGHNEKFAYYLSASASRTGIALEPPVEDPAHNIGTAEGLLTNMTYKLGNGDQLDWSATVRNDRDQVPVDPNDPVQTDVNYKGIRDIDEEQDAFATFSWNHAVSPKTLLNASPVFHFNDSRYIGGQSDPLVATSHNSSTYVGAQSEIKYIASKNNLVGGIYGFYQQESLLFGLTDNMVAPVTSQTFSTSESGGVGSVYANDQYQPWSWLTLNWGIRLTHFSGTTNENAANPRVGATVQIPRLHWILRSFYGTYYQPPPLYTVGGGLFSASLIGSTGFGYESLKGERDIQREFGLSIPYHGWVIDLDHFGTNARNFLDHDMLGNSNILLPLTTPDARIRGAEATVRTPQLMHRLQFHLAFSNMMAEYRGAPDGGLIEPVPTACLTGYCYLDHDQRNTLTTGFDVHLPYRTFFSNNVLYGSGVVNGDGNTDAHCPPHTTADVQFGKSLGEGEKVKFSLSVINLTNSRYALSSHNSFAGTHENNPREIIGSVRYHFHF
jgi:hypothetical protein